ncbi:MAG: hypothetical protein ACRYFX_04620 [Janthinobacterium lividum]
MKLLLIRLVALLAAVGLYLLTSCTTARAPQPAPLPVPDYALVRRLDSLTAARCTERAALFRP